MAESAGLGDFGCAVGDEPGFVAVSQAVEGKPGADRVGAHAGLGRLPSMAGRRMRRSKLERQNQVPQGLVNTNS